MESQSLGFPCRQAESTGIILPNGSCPHDLITVARSMQEKAGDAGKNPRGSAKPPRKSQCGKEGTFTPLDQ